MSMLINKEDLINYPRFDYNYHQARLSLLTAINSTQELNWIEMKDIALIKRGTVKSPIKKHNIFHTYHLQKGFWTVSNSNNQHGNSKDRIHTGDLLIKRVSRNCVSSIGLVSDHKNNYCSDCLLIIRPISKIRSVRLLFTLRTIYSGNLGRKLLERGTGATYVTEGDLLNLKIPMNLYKFYSKSYDRYRTAVSKRDIHAMIEIEEYLRKELNI
jgi:hypothetical protein